MSEDAYPHPELATATIEEFRSQLETGELTAQRLAEMHLERIQAVDRSGPHLRAVIELNPDALEIAERLDQERRSGRVRGPLHGIPVLVKDNIDTGDRMLTTAGSLALTGASASVDAPLVSRLREAGMVLLGKTNLSEWANFRSIRSTSGWSGRGRQTSNPYVIDRSPAGSSAGSAVAVSAGLIPVAVGTETDGSIISPSSVSGVVGFKPTVSRISQRGIIPIAASQDTAGPHARCVSDAAALYACLAGLRFEWVKLSPSALKARRIGVIRTPFAGYSEHIDRVYEEALTGLREAGAELIDPIEVTGLVELRSSEIERTILLHEFKVGLNYYLGSRTGIEVRSLEELIGFNLEHAAEEMPYFGQELLEMAEATNGLGSPEYQEAVVSARRLSRENGIDAALADGNLDVLVAPSGPPAWVIDRISGDRYPGGSAQPAAVAGYPNVTVPAGVALGELPIGLSFFTRPEREADLLAMAYAFEQVTRARRPPRYLPLLELP
jgi:amidase